MMVVMVMISSGAANHRTLPLGAEEKLNLAMERGRTGSVEATIRQK